MKKLIALMLLVLSVLVLASCGGDGSEETTKKKVKITNPPVESTAEPETKVDLSTLYKVVEFDKSKDFRTTVVNKMKEMGSIEWTCTKSFKISQKYEGWDVNYGFTEGVVYHGIPYADKPTGLFEFSRRVVDGKYTDGDKDVNDMPSIYGLQCVTSVNFAIQSCINFDANASRFYNPAHEEFMSDHFDVLGDIEVIKDGDTKTSVIKNGAQKMAEAYALLEPGDIVFEGSGYNHARLISGKTRVVKNDKGQISLTQSKVITCEQVNQLESGHDAAFIKKNGYDSTWWIDHEYSFNDLFGHNYMPITLKEYGHENDADAPYVALDNEIKAETLAKGSINGSVSSNMPLRYVLYQLVDANGKVVSETIGSNRYKRSGFTISNIYNADSLFANAVHGQTYTFRMYGCIVAGEALLSEVNFTFN